MTSVNIKDAKNRLDELVNQVMQGEEVVITRDNKPLLKLVPCIENLKERKPGTAKDKVISIAPDFDDLPLDFAEYIA